VRNRGENVEGLVIPLGRASDANVQRPFDLEISKNVTNAGNAAKTTFHCFDCFQFENRFLEKNLYE